MYRQYKRNPGAFTLFTADRYMESVTHFLQHLSPDIAIERFVNQSPKALLVAPAWGLKNFEFVERLKNYMHEYSIWQGQLWSVQAAVGGDRDH